MGRKKTRSASGIVFARSFPVRVIVVRTMGHSGNSSFILFKRGMEQNTSPTDAAWNQIVFFGGESWQKSHPLNQLPSKPLLEKAPEEEIGSSENKENSNKGIV